MTAATETTVRPKLYSDVVVLCDEKNEKGECTRRGIWGKVRPLTLDDFLPAEWTYRAEYRSETVAEYALILRPELEAEMREVGVSVSGDWRYGMTSDWNPGYCCKDHVLVNVKHTRKTSIKTGNWRNTVPAEKVKAQWDAAIARHKQELDEAAINVATNSGLITRSWLINRAIEHLNTEIAKKWERRRYNAVELVGQHYARLDDKVTPAEDLARLKAIREELTALREKREALHKESDEIVRRCTYDRLVKAFEGGPEEFKAAVTDALAKAHVKNESDFFLRG
jgi:hypothetical protein